MLQEKIMTNDDRNSWEVPKNNSDVTKDNTNNCEVSKDKSVNIPNLDNMDLPYTLLSTTVV
jgi:hypothetical protein